MCECLCEFCCSPVSLGKDRRNNGQHCVESWQRREVEEETGELGKAGGKRDDIRKAKKEGRFRGQGGEGEMETLEEFEIQAEKKVEQKWRKVF